MAPEPTAEGPSTPMIDPPDELFAAVGPDRDGDDFWTDADQAHAGGWASRSRRHRPTSERSLRHRAGAAWAAELSAMRALRGRPVGDGAAPPSRRRRQLGTALLGVAALLALAFFIAHASPLDHSSSDQAAATSATDHATDGASASAAGRGETDAQARTPVESQIVDPRPTGRTATSSGAAKKPTATAPHAAGNPAPAAAAPASATPSTPAPAPAAVPTTAAPKPTPTTVPTTMAPKPPAAPRVQAFTATTATRPGGECGTGQWAVTLAWSTTGASAVTITGLLETTQSGLKAKGSTVVCRLVPVGPLGGWTLTATGPGGSTTAKA